MSNIIDSPSFQALKAFLQLEYRNEPEVDNTQTDNNDESGDL